jgi:hypothetical protein
MRWMVLGIVLLTALVVVVAVLLGSAGDEPRRAPRGPRQAKPDAPAAIVLSVRVLAV